MDLNEKLKTISQRINCFKIKKFSHDTKEIFNMIIFQSYQEYPQKAEKLAQKLLTNTLKNKNIHCSYLFKNGFKLQLII
jgi:hypothetical protein